MTTQLHDGAVAAIKGFAGSGVSVALLAAASAEKFNPTLQSIGFVMAIIASGLAITTTALNLKDRWTKSRQRRRR